MSESSACWKDGSPLARGHAGRHGALGYDAGHHPEWLKGRPGIPHDGSRGRAAARASPLTRRGPSLCCRSAFIATIFLSIEDISGAD